MIKQVFIPKAVYREVVVEGKHLGEKDAYFLIKQRYPGGKNTRMKKAINCFVDLYRCCL